MTAAGESGRLEAGGGSRVVALTVELRRWTREEYERMIDAGILGENDRVELVAGEIVSVSPQQGRHAAGVSLGQETLRIAVGPDFHVRVQLPLALDPDSEPEPDLAVIAGSPRDYRDMHPTTAILVVEVSDTTLAFDRIRKASVYARAGIPEYWILNLQLQSLEVYRDPAPDPAAPLGYAYRQRLTFGAGDRVQVLMIPGAEVTVTDLLP
jgi:Uma2 family endonuclease